MEDKRKSGSIGVSYYKTVFMFTGSTFSFDSVSENEDQIDIYNKLKVEFDKIVALKAFW